MGDAKINKRDVAGLKRGQGPKRTFVHLYLPRQPQRLKRRVKSRSGKEKGRSWALGKIGRLNVFQSTVQKKEEWK